MIVTDGIGYFSEEKRHAVSEIQPLENGVPAFKLTNTSVDGRYRIEKVVVTDPRATSSYSESASSRCSATWPTYRLFALLAPHLCNRGAGNTAWVGAYEGVPMLLAERAGDALALACSAPWLARSAGYVGSTDGWQDLLATSS